MLQGEGVRVNTLMVDGVGLARRLLAQVGERVARAGLVPGLGVVLVGATGADRTHARLKREACAQAGLTFRLCELPADAPQAQVEQAVASLGADPQVHGILLQTPFPDHIDVSAIVARMPLEKDVDAMHPANLGLLLEGELRFAPCTAAGCLAMLADAGVTVEGARAAVVGTRHYAALATAMLLVRARARVSILPGLDSSVREADIVIAALGEPQALTGAMLAPGAAVVDLGFHRVEGRIVGDVDVESARGVAGVLTPVPGGAGPVTVAMILANTLEAAHRLDGRRET